MFFCDRIGTLLNRPYQSLDKEFTFSVFDRVSKVPAAEWGDVLNGRNLFLSLDYLGVLEDIDSRTFRTRYAVVYKNKLPFGIVYFQVIDFEAKTFSDLLEDQLQSIKSKRTRLFEKYIDENEKEVLMRLLTCGNNLVSGEHAFIFRDNVKKEKAFELLEKVIDKVGRNEKLRGKISAILVKDFYTPLKAGNKKRVLSSDSFIDFNVEPNMVVEIPAEVRSLNDYLALFSKKYRNRAKSILKFGEGLELRQLSAAEVKASQQQIFALYNQVFEKAKFKLIRLPEDYFYKCREKFGDRFFVNGFFLNSKLVAFYSGFFTPDGGLEAHYIGFDYELNKEHELYQNILYRFIEMAISGGCEQLNLGRTASEIKSTVGAKARELTCYIRPQNTISKVVLKPFIQFLQPTEWVPRNPFKETETVPQKQEQ